MPGPHLASSFQQQPSASPSASRGYGLYQAFLPDGTLSPAGYKASYSYRIGYKEDITVMSKSGTLAELNVEHPVNRNL